MDRNLVNILGINVSTLNKDEVKKKIDEFLAGEKTNLVATVNPEIILQGTKDEEYFIILNSANLAVPDGIGIKFAALALNKIISRFSGVSLTEYLLKKCEKEKIRVGILLWRSGLTKIADFEKCMKEKYPNLQFACHEISRETEKFPDETMDLFQPQIVFVALGAPFQERFIYHNLLKKNYIKIGIGVGGSFDYICGKIKRAPKIMQAFGLEWIFRIFSQPQGRKIWRLKRIYNALFVFTLKFLRWRFILPYLYRPNIACILYKKENDKYKILIVKRADWYENHWQLPQGGIDKQAAEQAGIRELNEELNTNKFRPIASFDNLHKYKFGDRGEKWTYALASQRHTGYKGQIQSLFIGEYFGRDEDIKVNYWDHSDWKWVDSDKLLVETHRVRREGYKVYLEKFKEIINK